MWKPPQRIKFEPAPGRVPTREEAARSILFSPVRIGPWQAAQRTWVPAMVPWRATDDGFVTPEVIGWYRRFAQGRPGVIVIEATGIRDVPSGPLLRIGDDRFVPGLAELARAVKDASGGATRLMIQLIDFLGIKRRPEPAKYFERFLRVTDRHRALLDAGVPGAQGWPEERIRAHLAAAPAEEQQRVLDAREWEALQMGARERVTDLHLPHVRELPQVLPGLFARAAVRAREAGFDGVELHYAHAYTMASFLSATNDRDDGYGGPREARVRLPLEVYRAVRDAVDPGCAVGCRYLADECVEGGNHVPDATWFGVEFARAGMDFLSLSRGGKFDDAKQPGVGQAAYPYTGPSGYECMPQYLSDERGPFGRNTEAVAAVRAAVRAAGLDTPVVSCGGIHSFEVAERMLATGQADVIAAARQTLSDPDWFLKLSLGLGDQVRTCRYSNYCEGLDQKHKQVTCEQWDRAALDAPGVELTSDGRRRLVAPPWTPPALS